MKNSNAGDCMYVEKIKTVLLLAMFSIALFSSNVLAQTAELNTAMKHMKAGSEQLKAGDYRAARDSFEQALRYADDSASAHLGLGIAFFHLRDDGYAERELLRATGINPQEAVAYQFLGELYYRRDDLDLAIASWEKAVALNPSAENLRARLERIRKEYSAEKEFNRDVTSHFQIKFDGRERIDTGRIVLRVLEDAYHEVGRALSYYPDREIQVLLYSGQQFQEVTDAPGWSGGIYDGKIRIPVGGIEQETPGLRRILYHEYTHAVVRAITPRCPTWLNEGLAQYFEGRQLDPRQKNTLRRMAQEGKLPQLSSLEGSFMGMDTAHAGQAYALSLSAVRYIVESAGMYRIRYVLDELASGANASKALGNGLTLSPEELERGWRQSLE